VEEYAFVIFEYGASIIDPIQVTSIIWIDQLQRQVGELHIFRVIAVIYKVVDTFGREANLITNKA